MGGLRILQKTEIMKKTIWAHTLVKNEERYLWFAVMSVVDFVDKVLLWDTGSTDKTPEIIKKLQEARPGKIEFKEVGEVDIEKFTKVRQAMLDETASDWFLVVDGDEVWWEKSIKAVIDLICKEGDSLETVVLPYYNIVGDIYHYQDRSAGNYRIDDKAGHVNIRAMKRSIPGLHLEKPHGQQGFYDKDGVLIQDRNQVARKFLDCPYLHFTNMQRSHSRVSDALVPKRARKLKYEIGIRFLKDFRFPEVFYRQWPKVVQSPWGKMPMVYRARAILETPFRKLKRKVLPSRPGY